MPSNLEIANAVIAAHTLIRQRVTSVGQALNDVEAYFSVQRAYADFSQSSLEAFAGKLGQMKSGLGTLEEGIRTHFRYEETYLPPLFGDALMKALIFEHRQITGRIETANATLAATSLEGMDQKARLAAKSRLEQSIVELSQAIEKHADDEEVVLHMLQRWLQHEAAKGRTV